MKKEFIAKELLKIAQELKALNDEEENQEIDMNQVNMEFFEKNVKTQNFPNFTKKYDESNDALTYFFNDDEMQTNYIIFWEDNGMWNYAVYINGQADTEIEKETCEEAFNDLISNIHKYVQAFNDALQERKQEMQEESDLMGSYKFKKVNNPGNLFKDSPVYGNHVEVLAAVFNPFDDSNKREISQNLSKMADEMVLNAKYIKSKNAIVFQIENRSDLKYVNSHFESFGWVKE